MSDRARHIFVISIVAALVLASLVVVVGIPGAVKAQKTRLGLDLKGGTELTFQAVTLSGKPPSSTELSDAINIMRSRSDPLGVSGVQITPQAEKVGGVAGSLFFYDWENSVIDGSGKIAGPNNAAATCDTSQTGVSGCGISY